MFRQVGIGAAAVLSIGLLAAGCSEDGDTIVTGGGGSQLPGNTDSSPFAGFQANNLAPDGGGFSENGASVDQGRQVELRLPRQRRQLDQR